MLTEAEVRFAKPREKAYKLYDERGLFLLVTPTGSRWWRFKYYVLGKERGMSLGVYPDVTLKDARERRDQLRRTVAQKVDPALQRQAEKLAQANTLRAVAEVAMDSGMQPPSGCVTRVQTNETQFILCFSNLYSGTKPLLMLPLTVPLAENWGADMQSRTGRVASLTTRSGPRPTAA